MPNVFTKFVEQNRKIYMVKTPVGLGKSFVEHGDVMGIYIVLGFELTQMISI